MNRKRLILIFIFLLVFAGLTTGYLIPKNTPVIAPFLNKNSIHVEIDRHLEREKINIELSIWGTEYEDIIIVENGNENPIPKGYGENDWHLSYDNKYHGVFRHFKTNNWHDHHYSFYFYKEDGQILCDVEIDGPDQMNNRAMKLDKEIKTDIGSQEGLKMNRK